MKKYKHEISTRVWKMEYNDVFDISQKQPRSYDAKLNEDT